MTEQEKIQNEINNIVPAMIEQAISSHAHTGQDSQILQGQYLSQAPQNANTTASDSIIFSAPVSPDFTLVTTNSSPYGLQTENQFRTLLSVISNLQTRTSQLESKLQALGLLN